MDSTLKIALVAACSAIVGGLITGVIAPHIAWGIEKRKQKLAYRRELVSKWRKMLIQAASSEDVDTDDGNFLIVLEHNEHFYSLVSHIHDLDSSYEKFKTNTKPMDTPVYLHYLADEVSNLEKKWDLI